MVLSKELADDLLGQLRQLGRQPPPLALKEVAVLMPDYTLMPSKRSPNHAQTPVSCHFQITPSTLAPESSSRASETHLKNMQQPCERDSTVFCIEIKPKCGFLPTSTAIHPGHSVKKRRSRFALHQLLKHSQVVIHHKL